VGIVSDCIEIGVSFPAQIGIDVDKLAIKDLESWQRLSAKRTDRVWLP